MTVPYTPTVPNNAEWDEYDPGTQALAIDLAWQALRYLTAGRVGNDAVMLRPCLYGVCSGQWEPYIDNGEWYNACQHSNRRVCNCTTLPIIYMPGSVADVLGVWEDGIALANGVDYVTRTHRTQLIRINGQTWTPCQDFTADYNAAGALAVEYVPGVQPGTTGLAAAGILASHFGYALTDDKKCKLPRAITSLTRNGISLDFQEGYFPNNVTGFVVVDTFVSSVNPNRLRQPSLVWSPDLPAGMTQAVPLPGD